MEVEEAVAMESETICRMIKTKGGCDEISLPSITSDILSKVIEYCNFHMDASLSESKLRNWATEFAEVDHATCIDLFEAATFLEIKGLKELIVRNKFMRLRSKDGEEFILEAIAAMESATLKALMRDQDATGITILPELSAATLSAVVEYCHNQAYCCRTGDSGIMLVELNAEFLKFHHEKMFDLIRAASYLDMNGLLHLAARPIANMMFCWHDKVIKTAVERGFSDRDERELIVELANKFK